jgi:hypothetical protein
VHHTKALAIDPEAVRTWLRRPSDQHPDFTRAESHGVDDEMTGPGEEDFLPTIRRVLAEEPDGVHRRPDVSRVELWLILDGEILHQGAVITIDLANGIRLASLHQDIKDFTDRDQHGVPAILSALDHIATQVCLLVDRYQTTQPGNQIATPAPTTRKATAPGTEPAPVTFTREEVSDAVNQAADDVLDAVDADDSGLRDGLNLVVNATLAYLTGEADDLTDVVEQSYEATYDEVLSWIKEAV